MKKSELLPLLPLRGITVFPYMVLHFDVTRDKSIAALEEAMVGDQYVFLVTQRDAKTEEPQSTDLYAVGTISKVKQMLKLPGDNVRVLVEGVARAKIIQYKHTEPYFKCEVMAEDIDDTADNINVKASVRIVHNLFENYFSLNNKISPDAILSIKSVKDGGKLADLVASNLAVDCDVKQDILDEFSPELRLEKLIEILEQEIEMLMVEKQVAAKVKANIDKNQKEYYLREQIKVIQGELGNSEDTVSEGEELKEQIEKADMPDEARTKALKEVGRFIKTPFGAPEATVLRTYLETVLSVPWNKSTFENLSLENAEKILNEDHYGLYKVKERILEYLAVKNYKDATKGNILCLVGPPGVGKTSIARSIARALNKNYVRMSLGGVRDEAEIRGHRKTYVGAMPGRIINAVIQAGSNNPLLLLDEIDKMASDFRGDPASALLEVLDCEQNSTFRDHYLELPFDLSRVMFVTTANTLDTIPVPLLDRLEIINLSSYTAEEKFYIAKNYLVKKQMNEHGLKTSNIRFTDSALKEMIEFYTRESGVRSLERVIAALCRKSAKYLIEKNQKSITVTPKIVNEFMGSPKYKRDGQAYADTVGVATGLAWTSVGGETLNIEVSVMNGDGKIELTGKLGDVMKESAMAAISYIRSNAENFGVDSSFYKKNDIHIHVPEGAIPKDGPSAGITICTAIISALTGIPVSSKVAMTGEITLRGRVLAIGGLKEKALAAFALGISKIIIPAANTSDLDEIPDSVKNNVKFIPVDNMLDVVKNAIPALKLK